MKYFSISDVARVLVHSEPVSMSKGFPALGELAGKMKGKEGDLFVFVNRKKDYCKVLFYKDTGMCIFSKKLTKGGYLFNRSLAKFDLKMLENFLLGEKREQQKAEMQKRKAQKKAA